MERVAEQALEDGAEGVEESVVPPALPSTEPLPPPLLPEPGVPVYEAPPVSVSEEATPLGPSLEGSAPPAQGGSFFGAAAGPEQTSLPATERQAPQPATEARAPLPATEAQAPLPTTEGQVPRPATDLQASQPATEAPASLPATERQASLPATERQASLPMTEGQAPQPAIEAPAPLRMAETPTQAQRVASQPAAVPEEAAREAAVTPAPADGQLVRAAALAEPLVRDALQQAAPPQLPAEAVSALERLTLGGVELDGEPFFQLELDDPATFELARSTLGELAGFLGGRFEEAAGILLQPVAPEGAGAGAAATADAAALALRFAEPALEPTPVSLVAPAAPTTPGETASEAALIQRAADVLSQIRVQLQPDVQRMSIQLMPDELGRVSIEIALQDGRVGAIVRVESPRTLELLERQTPELKALLAQSGLEIGEVQLELDQNAGRGAGSSFAQHGASHSHDGARTRAAATPPPAILDLLPPSRVISDDGVDTYA